MIHNQTSPYIIIFVTIVGAIVIGIIISFIGKQINKDDRNIDDFGPEG